MVNLNLLWQGPLFVALIGVLMSFEDPFRVALAVTMLALMDPVRRLVLMLDPAPLQEVNLSLQPIRTK
jgi:hypothetical protein